MHWCLKYFVIKNKNKNVKAYGFLLYLVNFSWPSSLTSWSQPFPGISFYTDLKLDPTKYKLAFLSPPSVFT